MQESVLARYPPGKQPGLALVERLVIRCVCVCVCVYVYVCMCVCVDELGTREAELVSHQP